MVSKIRFNESLKREKRIHIKTSLEIQVKQMFVLYYKKTSYLLSTSKSCQTLT
jgi:hypothetical protein